MTNRCIERDGIETERRSGGMGCAFGTGTMPPGSE